MNAYVKKVAHVILCFFRSYLACRENEKVQDQMLDCKLGRGRHLSDKENLKLESKRKKSESSVRKSDMEYYASCIKTERSRWDLKLVLVHSKDNLDQEQFL